MTSNIGTPDRALRLLAGAALIILALFSSIAAFDGAVLTYVTVIVGEGLIATSAMRMCPLLGVRTCEV